MRRLLLIDANGGIKNLVERAFDSTQVDLIQTDSYQRGLELIREVQPEVVILGLPTKDPDEIQAPREIAALYPRLPVILVSSGEPVPTVMADAKIGVFDILIPPIHPADLARTTWDALRTALDAKSFVSDGASALSEQCQGLVIGHNSAMKAVLKSIERLSNSDACVLISGESGTGKSLIAQLIHHRSRRRDGFIITVDCSNPQEILERDLFGHRPLHRVSRLEVAARGTLFLHHVDLMPLPTQSKLLQWLAEGARRELANRHRQDRTRIIASTTAVPEQAVAARVFREDLFRILGAVRVELPPLRDRLEDIPYLASYFLKRFGAESGQPTRSLSPIVHLVLTHYRWPENVRELENLLCRANSFASTDFIELGDLPADFLNAAGPALLATAPSGKDSPHLNDAALADLSGLSRTLFQWARKNTQFPLLPAMERELIIHAMAETHGNLVQTSKLLGITRVTLRKRLRRFNIQREVYFH
jgi:DNA-binding NtrC family response regulator